MIGWVDGTLIDPDEPVFALTDRAAILGDGLFETVKTLGDRSVFLDLHLERMRDAAVALDLPLDEAALRQGIYAVLTSATGQGALRLTVTRGSGGRGLAPIPRSSQRPRLAVTWTETGPPSDTPVRLHLSSVRRNPTAPSCRYKTLSYADAAVARAEAARAGADDALMLSTAGGAACTSIGNLWLRREDGFVTPPLRAGVLPGIVRRVLLDAGELDGLPITEDEIDESALRRFPLFRSNSLTGVVAAYVPGGAGPSPDNPLAVLYERLEKEGIGP